MQTLREKVYDLAAKERKTDQEIAELLNLERGRVNKWINELKEPSSEFYNLALYNQILFERNYLKGFVDKDFLEDIAKLSFQGMTFIEIAALFGTTENTILKVLASYNNKNSSIYNPKLYKKILLSNSKNMEISEKEIFKKFNGLIHNGVNLNKISSSSIVKKFYRQQNARRVIETLLKSDFTATDQYIATTCGVSSSFVSEILRGHDDDRLGYALFGEEVMQLIKQKRFERTETNRQQSCLNIASNNPLSHDEQVKLSTISQNINFWLRILFSFRLTLEEFGEIVHFTNLQALSGILYNAAECQSIYYQNALNHLFSTSVTSDKEQRVKAVQAYLLKLQLAKTSNPVEYKKLLEQINDHEYKNLVKKHMNGTVKNLTDYDIQVILKYRLKYALPVRAIPFNNEVLHRRCPDSLKQQLAELDRLNIDQSRAYFSSTKNTGLKK